MGWNSSQSNLDQVVQYTVNGKFFPKILKLAVQSSNTVTATVDLIRVHNYFRKHTSVGFAVLFARPFPPSLLESSPLLALPLPHVASPPADTQLTKTSPAPCKPSSPPKRPSYSITYVG
ncbi:hypothetical protein BV22DRAFT_1041833 [Leucogyrophana mollusca]|uniref:Uncharacterized protein n=1 Tax=Leucogyrophana mollusca TaxID=85980 RepID=A0ACB8AY62_9AGAM|nr:hypothetical protein BV22DRAFT_1041833 [Leucogyrophana mollusca]